MASCAPIANRRNLRGVQTCAEPINKRPQIANVSNSLVLEGAEQTGRSAPSRRRLKAGGSPHWPPHKNRRGALVIGRLFV
jgi:hypothetical protein